MLVLGYKDEGLQGYGYTRGYEGIRGDTRNRRGYEEYEGIRGDTWGFEGIQEMCGELRTRTLYLKAVVYSLLL